MKVILLKDVKKVGQKYDVKDIAPGYAANYLIPNKLAEIATQKKLKHVEELRKKKIIDLEVQEELLAKNLDALSEVSVTIEAKANEKGNLFKGIHVEEIIEVLKKDAHIDVLPEMILLPEPIKEVGEFDIEVKKEGKNVTFKLTVSAA